MYRFTTGVRAERPVTIASAEGEPLLTYRSFASVTAIVAALITAIVLITGVAAALFLLAEGNPLHSAASLVLTVVFTILIARLVPRIHVALYHGSEPALTIHQQSVFPVARYSVSTPEGARLADFRKSVFSRLGRNHWRVFESGRLIAEAYEEGFGRALLRKIAGKFSRRFDTDIAIEYGGVEVGKIKRRAGSPQGVDVLELRRDAIDPRVAVALATVILGSEP